MTLFRLLLAAALSAYTVPIFWRGFRTGTTLTGGKYIHALGDLRLPKPILFRYVCGVALFALAVAWGSILADLLYRGVQ